MILFVEEDCPSSLYLRILAKYLHLEKSFGLKIVVVDEALKHSGVFNSTVPTFVHANGQKFTSVQGISRELASIVNLDELLLGDSLEDQGEITKFFGLVNQKTTDILGFLQKELESKTFLYTSHITCADLFTFALIHRAMTELDDDAKFEHNHLFRWFDNIQHMRVLKDIFESFGLQKVAFPVVQILSKAQQKKLAKLKNKTADKEGEEGLGARARRKQKKLEQGATNDNAKAPQPN